VKKKKKKKKKKHKKRKKKRDFSRPPAMGPSPRKRANMGKPQGKLFLFCLFAMEEEFLSITMHLRQFFRGRAQEE